MTDELREITRSLEDGGMRCNCDLDNWEPERTTGHSCVCRIHKTAMQQKYFPTKPAAILATHTPTPPTTKGGE